jgi:hypothetical protein
LLDQERSSMLPTMAAGMWTSVWKPLRNYFVLWYGMQWVSHIINTLKLVQGGTWIRRKLAQCEQFL